MLFFFLYTCYCHISGRHKGKFRFQHSSPRLFEPKSQMRISLGFLLSQSLNRTHARQRFRAPLLVSSKDNGCSETLESTFTPSTSTSLKKRLNTFLAAPFLQGCLNPQLLSFSLHLCLSHYEIVELRYKKGPIKTMSAREGSKNRLPKEILKESDEGKWDEKFSKLLLLIYPSQCQV